MIVLIALDLHHRTDSKCLVLAMFNVLLSICLIEVGVSWSKPTLKSCSGRNPHMSVMTVLPKDTKWQPQED